MIARGWNRFGVVEGVRAAGWWSTDSITDSRTSTEGGRFRQGFDTASLVNHQLNPSLRGGGGCPCGGEVVNGLCHGLTDVNGWRSVSTGSTQGFGVGRVSVRRGVVVYGLCHSAQEQRGRRSRGWTGGGWFRQAQPKASGRGMVSVGSN